MLESSPTKEAQVSAATKRNDDFISSQSHKAITHFSKTGNLCETQLNHFQVKPSSKNIQREHVFNRITDSMNEVKAIMDKLPRHIRKAKEVNDRDLKELARIIQGRAESIENDYINPTNQTANHSSLDNNIITSPNIGRPLSQTSQNRTMNKRPMSTQDQSRRSPSNHYHHLAQDANFHRNFMYLQTDHIQRGMYNTPAEMKASVRKGLPSAFRSGSARDR